MKRSGNGNRGKRNKKTAVKMAARKAQKLTDQQHDMSVRQDLIDKILPWMIKICSRSKVGIAVSGEEHNPGVIYCNVDGRIGSFVYGPNYTRIIHHTKWIDLRVYVLEAILSARWRPLDPINVLDLLSKNV